LVVVLVVVVVVIVVVSVACYDCTHKGDGLIHVHEEEEDAEDDAAPVADVRERHPVLGDERCLERHGEHQREENGRANDPDASHLPVGPRHL
jgi:hypothetical protein